jgi:hypothetical protein
MFSFDIENITKGIGVIAGYVGGRSNDFKNV